MCLLSYDPKHTHLHYPHIAYGNPEVLQTVAVNLMLYMHSQTIDVLPSSGIIIICDLVSEIPASIFCDLLTPK